MLEVSKGPQPPALTAWQATPNATWGSVRSEDLWTALLAEQGHLCVYCQRRIPVTPKQGFGMHVEHWRPRSRDGGAFDWNNLFGVCPGDETAETGSLRGERHCDTAKGDAVLSLHPVRGLGVPPLEHLEYTSEGGVVAAASRPPDVTAKVIMDIATLNLSARRLMAGRVNVYEGLKARLDRQGWTVANLRKAYRALEARPGVRREPHAEVARYYLRRWAKKKKIAL